MNAKDAPCQIGFNAEQTRCFIKEAEDADQELNVVYSNVLKVLPPSDRGNLQLAQRLWIRFRYANCMAERGLCEGGSAALMVHAACLAADTRQRTELNLMYGWRVQKFSR